MLRAAAEGVSVPRLLIESTLNPQWRGEGPDAVMSRRQEALAALEQAADTRNLLLAIGRNINQIAKHVNSTDGELPEELSAALASVTRSCDEVTRRMRQVSSGRTAARSAAVTR
ncbi:mobilization protein MobC [Williamsia muralis]|nr:mobilization protein MobC [Williamsia marianensis]